LAEVESLPDSRGAQSLGKRSKREISGRVHLIHFGAVEEDAYPVVEEDLKNQLPHFRCIRDSELVAKEHSANAHG
jgi:hypothetical protein